MAKLPRAEIRGKKKLERTAIVLMKAGILGSVVYLTVVMLSMIQVACSPKKYPNGMSPNQAKVESARITWSPVGECWGGEGSWQCLSRNGLWTTCSEDGCQLLLYFNDTGAKK